MKKRTLKFSILILNLLLCFYFISCERQNLDAEVSLKTDQVVPEAIDEVDGHAVYASAQFLAEIENPEDLQYPILTKIPKEDYMINMEASEHGNVVDSRSFAGTYGFRINNPFVSNHGKTANDVDLSPPKHHIKWGGNWSVDLWKTNYGTCSRNVSLSGEIYNINGKHFDALKGKVVYEGLACASGYETDGGHVQQIVIYGVKNGVWHYMGHVVYAHIEDSSFNYSQGDVFHICTYPYRGYAYIGKVYNGWTYGCSSGCCSGSCHLHYEQKSSGWTEYHVTPGDTNIQWNEKIGSSYRWLSIY